MSVVEIDELGRKKLRAEAEKLARDDAVDGAKKRKQFDVAFINGRQLFN